MNTATDRRGTVDGVSSLDVLIEDLTRKAQAREAIDVAEYAARYPQYAERLQELLRGIEMLAELGESAAGGTDSQSVQVGNQTDYQSVLRQAADEPISGLLGDFRILREIGRGGMGVVYEAEQISLSRRVALKVLPFAGMLDPRALQRFHNEARAAAGLHHSHIVPVFAVGENRGVHYYAMQYIEGRTIAELIRQLRKEHSPDTQHGGPVSRAQPDDSTALQLDGITAADPWTASPPGGICSRVWCRTVAGWGVQVAAALDYAHRVGVVHRDIKPANLILDRLGDVWITDFGLARLESDASVTVSGTVMGTLRYMSPEQALGERGLVDQRSDVYSLGVTLYELLTLAPAVNGADRDAILARMNGAAVRRPRQVNPAVPVELETIVLKSIAEAPADRYATAQEFADDLQRFLNDQPVRARRASVLDRVRKWSRRNRLLVRSLVASGLVLLAGLTPAALMVQSYRERARLDQLEREQQSELAGVRQGFLLQHAYAGNVRMADLAWKRADSARARQFLAACVPKAGEPDQRGFEWHLLERQCTQSQPAWASHDGSVVSACFSPDDRLLATAGEDGARVWDVHTRTQVVHIEHEGRDVNSVAFSPDGSVLATAGDDGCVRLWDTHDWRPRDVLNVDGLAACAVFSPDGRLLAAAQRDRGAHLSRELRGINRLILWRSDGDDWLPHAELGDDDYLHAVQFADDGSWLATGSGSGEIVIWDVATLESVCSWSIDSSARTLQFVRDKSLLLAGDGRGRLWQLEPHGGRPLTLTVPHGDNVESLVATADGDWIATAGRDRQLRVWERVTQDVLGCTLTFRDDSAMWCVAVDHQHRTLVSGGEHGAVKLWDPARPQDRIAIRPSAQSGIWFDMAWTPGDGLIVCAADSLRLYDPRDGRLVRELLPEGSGAASVAVAPDGRSMAVWDSAGVVRLLDIDNASQRWERPLVEEPPVRLVFSPDGETLNVVRGSDGLTVLDSAKGEECDFCVTLPPDLQSLTQVEYSRDGRWMAVALNWWGVQIYDRSTGDVTFRDVDTGIVAFTPDSTQFVTTSAYGAVRVWDVAKWQSTVALQEMMGEGIRSLAVSPDGRSVAAALPKGSVKLWHLPSARDLVELEGFGSAANRVAFSPDGRFLAACGVSAQGQPEFMIWCGAR